MFWLTESRVGMWVPAQTYPLLRKFFHYGAQNDSGAEEVPGAVTGDGTRRTDGRDRARPPGTLPDSCAFSSYPLKGLRMQPEAGGQYNDAKSNSLPAQVDLAQRRATLSVVRPGGRRPGPIWFAAWCFPCS